MGRTYHPLDALRRRLTKGLEVTAGEQSPRRGEAVEAQLTITGAGRLGAVEVGLRCTEIYDEESRSTDSRGNTTTSRTTSDAVACETWVPVESVSGVQTVRLPIPSDAPFSYEGDCLSFKWEVVARGRKRRRLDARAAQPIVVRPVSPELQLQVEHGPYAPGETIRGTVTVLEGGGSRSLEVVLRFMEKTNDYRSEALSISTGPLHTGDLQASTTLAFEVTIPADGLPGYRSEHGELYWELDARSDEAGFDTHAKQRIAVQ